VTSVWRLLVVGLLVTAGATAGTEAARAGTADSTRVVRATGVSRLFALDGTLLYATLTGSEAPYTVRWARVVDGERSAARGIPANAHVDGARAVGRDSAGHVVVAMQQWALQQFDGPWWLYDVTRDEARPLSVPATPGCTVSDVAVWGERMAWVERCPATPEDPAPVAVGLRDGTETSMWSVTERYVAETRLALGPDSLAVLVATDSGPVWVHRIVDRGRVCVIDGQSPAEAAQSIGWAGEGPGWYARGIWLGTAGLEWALANDEGNQFGGRLFADLAVMASPLSGACQTLAEQRYLAAPAVRMGAVAIDGRSLYYATETAIYRHRLAARGTTKPPANDDFADATFLGSRFPLHATGRIGHATRQRRDPRFEVDGYRPALDRTVWYAFRPSRSGTVYRGGTGTVFTRSRRGSLRRVREHTTDRGWRFSVEAGRKYWVMVGGGPEPNYQPFTIDFRRRPFRW
jgi:hypothetical protein